MIAGPRPTSRAGRGSPACRQPEPPLGRELQRRAREDHRVPRGVGRTTHGNGYKMATPAAGVPMDAANNQEDGPGRVVAFAAAACATAIATTKERSAPGASTSRNSGRSPVVARPPPGTDATPRTCRGHGAARRSSVNLPAGPAVRSPGPSCWPVPAVVRPALLLGVGHRHGCFLQPLRDRRARHAWLSFVAVIGSQKQAATRTLGGCQVNRWEVSEKL